MREKWDDNLDHWIEIGTLMNIKQWLVPGMKAGYILGFKGKSSLFC